MKNIKTTLSIALLLIFACSLLMFGCGDKYKDLKVTTDAPEQGIFLYKGKDTPDNILSVATFTATVSGAGNNVSTKLKHRFSNNGPVTVLKEHNAEQTTFTVTAQDYGTTILTIFPEEADHITTTVKITVVKELEQLNLFSSYKPFVFAGSSTIIDTAKAIDYQPGDTTQLDVTYSMVGNYTGVTVEPNGNIIASNDAPSGWFEVVATSVDNPSISSNPISVRVFKPILPNDITVSYSDGNENLVLSTSALPAEVIKMVTLNINTSEDYFIDKPTVISSITDLVETERVDNNNFKITGVTPGIGTLSFYIALVDGENIYQNTKVKVDVPVRVKQYATTVSVNGSTDELKDIFLYDTYQNQIGAGFTVVVGEQTAEDKHFVVSVSDEDLEKLTIVDSSNKQITPYNENGYFDVLDNNTTLYIRIKDGYTQETQVKVDFIAYGTLGLSCDPIKNSVTAQLKHGVKSFEIQPYTMQKHTDGIYLLGIDTNPADDTEIILVEIPKDQFTSYIKTTLSNTNVQIQEIISYKDAVFTGESTIYEFVVKGLDEGLCSIEFIAENGIYNVINIRVYKKVNAYQVTSQTINQNSSIGEVKQDTPVYTFNGTDVKRNSLSKIAIALNGEVKLGIIPIYFDGNNAYNVNTKYVISCNVVGSNCVTYLNNNTLIAKRLTEEGQTETITVSMTVYCETGVLELPDHQIEVEVFYDIKQVYLDQTYVKLYTFDDLALADKDLATHTFKLFYNDGIKDIEIEDNILWKIGGQDQGAVSENNGTVTASRLQAGRDKGLANITAIYGRYGRTYIVQANIEIIKAERTSLIYNLTYTKDGKTTLLTKQNVLVNEQFNSDTGEVEQTYSEEYYIYLDARKNIQKGVTTFTIGQTIVPANAYNKTLIYKAENAIKEESVPVLLIDENGKVTINRTGGTAYIYIFTKDSENPSAEYGYDVYQKIFVKIADGTSSVTALEIANEYDLVEINNNVESLSKFYQITKDINLSNLTVNSNWTPIGYIDGKINEFSGNINGKTISKGEIYICTITGFNINMQSADLEMYAGLFAKLSSNAVINNLNLVVNNINVKHTANDANSVFAFGGLTAVNNGQIKNVNVEFNGTKSQITEYAYTSNVGGLVGVNNSTIQQCYTSGKLNHTKQNSLGTSKTYIGGLVGVNYGQINGESYLVNDKTFADKYTSLINIDASYINTNNVKTYNEIVGDVAVGGVVGYNDYNVVNCSFDGTIKAINNVGGIVGLNNNSLYNCFASGKVNAYNNVGGLVGNNFGNIDFCAVNMFDDFDFDYQGELIPNIIGNNDFVGGLVGQTQQGTIINCYVKTYFIRTTNNYLGDILINEGARAQNVGGLIGSVKNTTVSNCFSQVNINAEKVNAVVGGLVGSINGNTVENCYSMGTIKLKDENSFAGKIFGSVTNTNNLITSYSTILDDDINIDASSNSSFVGKTINGNLNIAFSYHLSSGSDANSKSADYLKNISTYKNWSIGDSLSKNTIWYINANNNNGYPMLVINNQKLSIEAPNSISAILNEKNDYMYKLSDNSAILWRGSTSLTVNLVDANKGLFSSITVNPQDAGMAYRVSSSDESIVRITGRNNDRIVPVANGEVTLTITSRLNNTATAVITLYVVNKLELFKTTDTNIVSLVNQRKAVNIENKNASNYRYKIQVYGGNNQYININNLTINSVNEGYDTTDSFIDIIHTNKIYIFSTKSITTGLKIFVTPYIEVASQKIFMDEYYGYKLEINYSSYYGIKSFTSSLKNVELTENDSAIIVYTLTGDDLRVGDNIPELNISINQSNNVLNLTKLTTVKYDIDGEIIAQDNTSTEVTKIVYEYILKVDKDNFNLATNTDVQKLKFEISANVSFVSDTANTKTEVNVTKQQLKNIAIEFFTESQKVKNASGETEYTVNEASSHKIIAGRTGMLKASLYPNTADIAEVRVYSLVTGVNNNISMSQMLKRTIYDNQGQKTGYRYVERKPYAINLVDKNGLVLWNESNIDGTQISFDGSLYIAFTIPSNIPISTSYTVFIEVDLKDGRTIIQNYLLYSDIPSDVELSYNFEGLQTLTDMAYVAYGVQHSLVAKFSKIPIEIESSNNVSGLTITQSITYKNGVDASNKPSISLVWDGKTEGLSDPAEKILNYNFIVTDKDIENIKITFTMEKIVNNQLAIFKSNTITFCFVDFVVKSVSIDTGNENKEQITLATNNSKELKIVVDAQYDTTKTEIQNKIKTFADDLSKNLCLWQAKRSKSNVFTALTTESDAYDNFVIFGGNTTFISLQPQKASSGEEIYFAVELVYTAGSDKPTINNSTNIVSLVKPTGFNDSNQTLITKITTNFYRDVSAKNSIPVGNLVNEIKNTSAEDVQKAIQKGEVNFLDMQNGTSTNMLYYRLKEDITLTNYTPKSLSYVEFDGNGYTITIQSFSEEALLDGNIGLFKLIDANSMVSNVNVVYNLPTQDAATGLPYNQLDYTTAEIETLPQTINFGGLASENQGIIYNCKVAYDNNVEDEKQVISVKTPSTSQTQVNVGGLVAKNAGYISFSQSTLKLLVNRGYLGGLVAENTNRITASKVIISGVDAIKCTSTTEVLTLVGGFVARNSGKIYTSYIQGENGITTTNKRYSDSISSNTPIGAFVNTNVGQIINCYANVTVKCQTRSSGFVYDNSGLIESCYTISKMIKFNSAHNPFTGVDETGVKNTGNIKDCYYLTDDFGSTTQEPATKLSSINGKTNFAGFVFADNNINGTWKSDSDGPQLVDANLTIVSRQYYNGLIQDEQTNNQTYNWTFSYTWKNSNNKNITTNSIASGKVNNNEYNLRTITNFTQFNDSIYHINNDNSTLNDYFVLLKDITCNSNQTPQSASLQFRGTFIGNNMTISNLYLKASNTHSLSYFGLFGSIKGNNNKRATLKDLNISAKQAVANNTSYVGILAGEIINSDISNINIDGSGVVVQGKYFVGGLAGIVEGSNITKVNISATVNAGYRGTEKMPTVFNSKNDSGNYQFTYSGVAVGVLTSYNNTTSKLKGVTVTGNSIAIGYYSSACVGLVDSGSTLSLANVQIDPAQYVRAYYVAGGVVAENRGAIDRCSIEHVQNVQYNIDTTNSTAYRNLTFFQGAPQVIGGLVGFNNNGSITYSYSKVDVRATTRQTKVAGGLVGTIIDGEISYSYATGSVISQKIIGGLIGSITSKTSISTVNNNTQTEINGSALFEQTNKIIDNDKINISNVIASNRWLSSDIDLIATANNKGLLIGCFNKNITKDKLSQCFVNTQVTQNSISNKTNIINTLVNNNAVLSAFLKTAEKISTDNISKLISYGEYTDNFDGTKIGSNEDSQVTIDISSKINCLNNGTPITFYFLSNFDANMDIFNIANTTNQTLKKYLNAPSKDVSIYSTIIYNLNV